MFFFLSSSLSDELLRNKVTLDDGFLTKQQRFTLSSAPAHRFFATLKSHEAVQTGHWRTMASFTMPFSLLVWMHTNPLATKQASFKIAELEIRLCAWRQGESLASIVDSVFEQSSQRFFNQYCIHLLRKPVRTDLLLCDKMANFSSSMHLLLKTLHKQD